jgi:HAD superfamily hydrolase (TIGR01549 family)
MRRALIFDWDDTLVRTKQCRFAAIQALSSRYYSFTLSDAEIASHWGRPFRDLFSGLFSTRDDDVERVIERYLMLVPEFPLEAYEGTVEALVSLVSAHSIGILTSASRRVVLPDLKRLGLPFARTDLVQCAEDTECHKPDPRVFDPLIATLARDGIAPRDIVYVGDSVTDYEAARGGGRSRVHGDRPGQ